MRTGQPFGINPNPAMNVMEKFEGGAGGGVAGQVDYPPYIKNSHAAFMYGSTPADTFPVDPADFISWLGETTKETWGAGVDYSLYHNYAGEWSEGQGSPFAAAAAYDPTTDMGALQTEVDALVSIAGTLAPTTDIASYVTVAVAQATVLLPTTEIDDVVDAFEARALGAFQRQVGRVAADMFGIRSVMSTQYDMTIANMEGDRGEQLNDVDARMRFLTQEQRYTAKSALTESIMRLVELQIRTQQMAMAAQFDSSKLAIVAYQDQILSDLDLEQKHRLWNLNLLQYGQNAMASISGSQLVPRAPTEKERLIGAVLNAGSIGLQVGTAMGNPAAGGIAGFGYLALNLLGGI